MTPLRRIFQLARPFHQALGSSALFYVLYTLVSLFSLGMIIPVLEVILGAGESISLPSENMGNAMAPAMGGQGFQAWIAFFVAQWVQQYGALGTLVRVCMGAMGLFLAKNVFRYAALWNMATLRTGITATLRGSLHSKILALAPGTVSEKRKGDILARASNDVTEVEWAILTGLELLVREPLVILGSLAILLAMSWKLTLILLIIAPLAGALLQWVSKRLKRKSSIAQDRLGDVLSAMEESLSGLRILQAFQAESYQHQRFDKVNQQAFEATRGVHRRRDLASPLSELIGVMALLLILFFGGREVLAGGGLTGATLVAYLLFFYQLIPAFKSVSMALYNVQKGSAAAERLFDIMDLPEEIVDPPQTNAWTCPSDGPVHIQFDQVHFTYPGAQKPAIDGLSLQVNRGETVALVGPSGGGKTTLINLLMRAMDPTAGQIRIDDLPLTKSKDRPQDAPISLKAWRVSLALVTQDAFLFDINALENIALGDPQPNQARAREAAKAAQALAFIEALPEKWVTPLGEGGCKLSGGQRQRMALARAIYRAAPVLLLDEATSALDAENERLVQQALEAASQGRTTLVVAHRLSTVQRADRIIVLDNGQMVEEGTHTALMSKQGLYANLVQTQMFEA